MKTAWPRPGHTGRDGFIVIQLGGLIHYPLARQGDDGDTGRSVPRVAREDNLGAFELDGVLTVADDATELLSFLER